MTFFIASSWKLARWREDLDLPQPRRTLNLTGIITPLTEALGRSAYRILTIPDEYGIASKQDKQLLCAEF
jgi:hypothetical protein